MAINSIVKAALNTNWSKTDDFKIYLYSNSGLNADTIMEDVDISTLWEKSVISVSLPSITSTMNQQYVGGEWRITPEKPELFRVSIRFRDFNFGDLKRYFGTLWTYSQYNYPEDAYLTLTVTDRNDQKVLFSSDKVLVEQVSEVTMDTTGNAITEFTVEFVSPTYSDDYLNNMGSAEYGTKFASSGSSADISTIISSAGGLINA